MGDDGADRFLAVYELYVNFHRSQVRRERKRVYPYAGMCPLGIAGQSLTDEIEDRQSVAIWLDALGI
jgi:hypothetical protein